MKDPERIDESKIRANRLLSIDEILELISKVWHKYPDLRLCQLIDNCFPGDTYTNYYYIEDDRLQARLEDTYEGLHD